MNLTLAMAGMTPLAWAAVVDALAIATILLVRPYGRASQPAAEQVAGPGSGDSPCDSPCWETLFLYGEASTVILPCNCPDSRPL